MGFGFVILIHLVAIFIISVLIALFWMVLTRFLANVENRKKKILFAGVCPFIGLYTFYFLGLFGLIFVSEIKDVDIGIGDYWYVPIKDNCKLTFTDQTESSNLENNNKTLIKGVEYIQQTDNNVYGKTYDSLYFSFNLNTRKLSKYKNKLDFLKENKIQQLNFKNTNDFYIDRKNEVAGIYFKIVGIISLIFTILGLWKLRKLIVRH